MQHTQLLNDEHIHGIVLNSRDVSERKVFEEQLAHQAFHDPVTNLANRALFVDRVQHALRSTVRMGSLICVMFVDLDDFKTVNDSLGHPAGDAILKEVAGRLEGAFVPPTPSHGSVATSPQSCSTVSTARTKPRWSRNGF